MLKRILIAEHDPMDAGLAVDALCECNFADQIQVARDGAFAGLITDR